MSFEFIFSKEKKEQNISDKDTHFFGVPSTPGTNGIYTLLGNTNDLETFENRAKMISHSTTVEVKTNPGNVNNKAILTKTENTELTIELADIDKTIGNNKGVKKVFVYILYKLSKQQISENLFEDLSLEFNLQDLVDIGLYSNIKTARVGFNNAIHTLTSLKVQGIIKDKREQKDISGGAIEVLFTGARILNSRCVLYLNKRINWPVFALLYFAPLPTSYFSLPLNASDLQYYVFTQARKNKKELLEKGFFKIKLRTIQQQLGLISETKTKSPTDKIKRPILEAVEKVNQAENSNDFKITVEYDKNGTIKDFLDNGYIYVHMKGEYSKHVIEIAEHQEKIIQANMRKKEKITEQAQIKALDGSINN